MNEQTKLPEERKPRFLANILNPIKSFFAMLFEPITKKEFWIKLVQSAVQEAMASTLVGIGQVLYKYGNDKKSHKEIPVNVPPQSQQDVGARAFGYNAPPSYHSQTPPYVPPSSYPVSPMSNNGTFPGLR